MIKFVKNVRFSEELRLAAQLDMLPLGFRQMPSACNGGWDTAWGDEQDDTNVEKK